MTRGFKIALLLAPALLVIGILFVGGLFAALLQSLGYSPAIGMTEIKLDAYREILGSEDFLDSLLMTLYVAGASTLISTVLAVLALRHNAGRLSAAIFQLPITIPHLVAAVGMAPATFLYSYLGGDAPHYVQALLVAFGVVIAGAVVAAIVRRRKQGKRLPLSERGDTTMEEVERELR